jgi:heme-degrading monooxygenase HmoA
MSYIRLSMAVPQAERAVEIRQQYERLLSYLAGQPGYLSGWVVAGRSDGEIGRLSIWESEAAANRAATDSYVLALHAKVRSAATGQLWDRSFMSEGPAPYAPTGPQGFDPAAVVRAAQGLLGEGTL